MKLKLKLCTHYCKICLNQPNAWWHTMHVSRAKWSTNNKKLKNAIYYMNVLPFVGFFSSFYFSVPDSDHASGWLVGLLAITCISITILACTCCHRSKSGFEVSCQNCIPFCSHLKFNTDQNNKWKIKPNKSRTKNPRKQTNKTFLVSKSLAITL